MQGQQGAAQDVPESLVERGCRELYGQKVRSISCAEAKGWGCVSQAGGAASQELGCTLGVFSEMVRQQWIPHLAKTSRLGSGVCRGEGVVSVPGTVGQVFGEVPSRALCTGTHAHTCAPTPLGWYGNDSNYLEEEEGKKKRKNPVLRPVVMETNYKSN